MANQEHVDLVKRGSTELNEWRTQNPGVDLDLKGADLAEADLSPADFPDLLGMDTTQVDIAQVDLTGVAHDRGTNLAGADLRGTNLAGANLNLTNLSGADLSGVPLFKDSGANLTGASLIWADLSGTNLNNANLFRANLAHADLSEAKLFPATLREANLTEAHINNAQISQADLTEANLTKAWLLGTNLSKSNLTNANLTEAMLWETHFYQTDLTGANLSQADLHQSNLFAAKLRQANLHQANLSQANLVGADLTEANLASARVYGISVWDPILEGTTQSNLIITRQDDPVVTVDQLEVAQFIYLLLHNEKVREVIDTVTSKAVLILGRFTPERKAVLDAMGDALRSHGLIPIIFDFERARSRDFTETIRTLAGLSLFVIVDITNPRSAPLELEATVPNYEVPFVPIIQEGEEPFSMFADLTKYDWVLKPLTYSSLANLMTVFKSAIIDEAIGVHQRILVRKNRALETRSVDDYLLTDQVD